MENFGKIKNGFNDLFVKSIGKKDDMGKQLFKKYIKTIKESEILKTQFMVFHNIENRVDPDAVSASYFIAENLNQLKKYKKSDILKENEKLSDLLPDIPTDYELSNLHESLSKLIFTDVSVLTVNDFSNELKNVTNYVTSNKQKQISENIDFPISILTKLVADKYNKKYDGLSESDKKIIKVLLDSDFESKKTLYSTTVNECIQLVDGLISETKNESTDRLQLVKKKLTNDDETLNESNFVLKFSRLVELKENLTTSKND